MSSKMKHTPGPWDAYGRVIRDVDGGEDQIAGISDWGAEGEVEALANARLIASAPDLLAALLPFAAMAQCTGHTDTRDGEVVMRLQNPSTGEWVVLKRADFRGVTAAIAKRNSVNFARN